MKLSIITINYNSSENTIKLLESLRSQTDKDFEVIVVDNNSNPDQKSILKNYRTEATNITLIENDKNLGFSGGNNVGIRRALNPPPPNRADGGGADWVLLLNNDTIPENHLIEHLRANLEGRGGIMGLALNEGDRTAYAGKVEWLKSTLSHTTSFNGVRIKTVDKLYAIGGAMLIHKSVFNKIGFLDENYFLYFEDADFCQKARKAGIPVSFLPEIKISHSVSSSTKKLGSPMLLRYHYRNALYFNWKNGPGYIKIFVPFWLSIIFIKQIFKISISKNIKESKAIIYGLNDFIFDRMGQINPKP